MLNSVNLQGRMVRQLDLKILGEDKQVGNFSLAVQRNFKNRDGDYDADFIDCTVWGKTAELIGNYFGQGDQIIIEGELRQETWEGDNGKRSKLKVNVNGFQFVGANNSQNNSNAVDNSNDVIDGFDDFDDDF